jgi:hypothetical protein
MLEKKKPRGHYAERLFEQLPPVRPVPLLE